MRLGLWGQHGQTSKNQSQKRVWGKHTKLPSMSQVNITLNCNLISEPSIKLYVSEVVRGHGLPCPWLPLHWDGGVQKLSPPTKLEVFTTRQQKQHILCTKGGIIYSLWSLPTQSPSPPERRLLGPCLRCLAQPLCDPPV